MPTTRNEDYRFTDISPVLKSHLHLAAPDAQVDSDFIDSLLFSEVANSTVVVVNGVFRPDLSRLSGIPEGVHIGGIRQAPANAIRQLVSSHVRSAFPVQYLCLVVG